MSIVLYAFPLHPATPDVNTDHLNKNSMSCSINHAPPVQSSSLRQIPCVTFANIYD